MADETTTHRGGRITALTTQRRDPERMNLFLDGTFAFSLSAEILVREGLTVGDDLDAARVATLLAADQASKATNAALALLAHRPRSEREVRDRLRQRGFGPAEIDEAIAKIERWGYLDDAAFARSWVENRVAHKPRGERLLSQELWRKGVPKPLIDAAIAEAEVDEATAALELGRSKLRSYQGLEPAIVRRRLAAFLARRGYGFDVVRPVLDQLLADDEAGETWDQAP